MDQDALAFSGKGDEVFQALASEFPEAKTWRLLFEQKLRSDRFEQIRASMLSYLSAVLQSPKPLSEPQVLELLLERRGKISNYTAGGMVAPRSEHTLEFNLLHRSIARAFGDFALDPHIEGIDLPINVRMVYGQADGARSSAAFSSTKRHSDVWAGVPVDAAVVVLPVLGDIDNLTIECAEMPVPLELATMRGMKDYDEGKDVPVAVPYREGRMKLGHLYVADARLLHQTIRKRPSGVRISIDFRFRYKNPEYRALVPNVESSGPDSFDSRVPYPTWLAVGSQSLIVFDRSMNAPAIAESSSPINMDRYRLVRISESAERP
jgi:hypothetical protein